MAGGIFVSYSSRDASFARRLVSDLRHSGVAVWFDESNIQPGDSFVSRIAVGLAEASCVIVILSPDAVASDWVLKEINLAVAWELDGKAIKVIPLLYRDCAMPPVFRDKQFADFRGGASYEKALRGLLVALPNAVRGTADVENRVRTAIVSADMLATSMSRSGESTPADLRRLHALVSRTRILIGQTKILTALEDGSLSGFHATTDLSMLVPDLISIVSSFAHGYQMSFDVTTPENRMTVLAEPSICELAIYHLLDNAVKYSYPGTIQVTLSTHRDLGTISVRNRGITITAEDRGHITKRGYRGAAAVAVAGEGAGLGLYVVNLAASASGGFVEYAEEQGENVFRVSLPLA